MIKPKLPKNEAQRLQALYSLNILDTDAEERFDRVTRIAQKLFNVPIALVSIVDKDRQWFKSKYGIEATETPREISFCGHAILYNDIMIVEDATKDVRFNDNPLVIGSPDIKFYLGCPLKIQKQYNVATLCLIDRKTRQFNNADLEIIKDLANMLEAELEAMHLSTTDELTGVSNRRGFLLIGEQILRLCERYNKPLTLIYFDLDKFKYINDTFGHDEGDQVLKTFSKVLSKSFRNSDVVARLGGDEFSLLCSGLSEDQLPELIQRFQKKIDAIATPDYKIEFSYGVIQYNPAFHPTIHSLIEEADKKMYEHKKRIK